MRDLLRITSERVPLADGGADTYIAQDKFHHQFAADLLAQRSALMAVTQRGALRALWRKPRSSAP